MTFAKQLEAEASRLASSYGEILYSTAKASIVSPITSRTAFNGYVKVPAVHPWRHLSYDETNHLVWDKALHKDLVGGSRELTYSDEETGWIGFDTLHVCDNDIPWTEASVREAAKAWAQIVSEATK